MCCFTIQKVSSKENLYISEIGLSLVPPVWTLIIFSSENTISGKQIPHKKILFRSFLSKCPQAVFYLLPYCQAVFTQGHVWWVRLPRCLFSSRLVQGELGHGHERPSQWCSPGCFGSLCNHASLSRPDIKSKESSVHLRKPVLPAEGLFLPK